MNPPIELKVIDGIKKEKPDYYTLYSNVFVKVLEKSVGKYKALSEYDRDTIKKLILLGVKTVINSKFKSKDKETLLKEFSLISFTDSLMSLLTPAEFENIFPIDKDYKGEKWGMKDYFYTRKYIEDFGIDKVIGDEIFDFLWEYHNRTINNYMAEKLSIISDLRRLETGKGIMEEFLEEHNIPTYTLFEDANGKKYMKNNQTGEILKVRKPKPRYLNVVK